MTSTSALGLILVSLALYLSWQRFVDRTRCVYCGQVNTHEETCPYAGTGM